MAAKEDASERLPGEITGLASKKEGLASVVTEIRVALAQTKERHGSLKKLVYEKTSMIEGTGRRITARLEEIERAKAEVETKTSQTGEIKAMLEGLLADVDKVKKE